MQEIIGSIGIDSRFFKRINSFVVKIVLSCKILREMIEQHPIIEIMDFG